jgi:L-2-hydroxycarboxylate dehydrogenase (NAD+)
MGMVVGVKSMQMAIDKARMYGMGSVAVCNSTHFGIDGYYAMMAVKAGMIVMRVTNARPSIAPTFGVQPLLGTNPIAFGAPTDEDCSFLYDGAISIAQRGKFELLQREGKQGIEGWVIDQNGNFLTDPTTGLNGLSQDTSTLLSLGGAEEKQGGHKGYGLATIVEILSASLKSGAFLHQLLGIDAQGNRQHFRFGHFFMAINIESFTSLDEFKKNTGDILRELRSSRKSLGHKRIYTAGEKEYEMEKYVRVHGVPVIPSLQKDFKVMQQELKLTQYNFPF